MIFEFSITNDTITGEVNQVSYSGNREYYACHYVFHSDEWKELSKFAVFKTNQNTYTCPIENDSCSIPYEVLLIPQTVFMGVFGIDTESALRVTTGFNAIYVNEGAYSEGEAPSPPTPDIWETYYAEITKVGGFADRAESAKEEAETAQQNAEGAKAAAEEAKSEAEEAKAEAEKAKSELLSALVNYYNKTQVDDALSVKADAETVNYAISLKANANEVYNKTETYNKDEVYVREEIDDIIINLAEAVDEVVEKKASSADVYTKSETYNKDEVLQEITKKFSEMVDSAPETLDTLAELSEALGNDPNFATTVANEIGIRAKTDNVLTKDNDTPYEPTEDYHPATKAYVDNWSGGIYGILSDHDTAISGLQGGLESAEGNIDTLWVVKQNTTVVKTNQDTEGMFTLFHNEEERHLNALSRFTFVPLLSPNDDFYCSVVFTTSAEFDIGSCTIDSDTYFQGEDCEDGSFNPIPNKHYNVVVWWDGTVYMAVVGGYAVEPVEAVLAVEENSVVEGDTEAVE